MEESFYEGSSYCSDDSPLIDEVYEMVDDLAEAFGSEDVSEECRLRYLAIVLNEAPSGCLDDYEIGLEDLLLAIPGTDRAVIERCIPLLESHGKTRVIQSLFLNVLGDSEGYRTYKEDHLSSPQAYYELIRHYRDVEEPANAERFCWKAIFAECSYGEIVHFLYDSLVKRKDTEGIIRFVDTLGWQYFVQGYSHSYDELWIHLQHNSPSDALHLLSFWFFSSRTTKYPYFNEQDSDVVELDGNRFYDRYADLARLSAVCGVNGIEEKALQYAKKTSSLDWLWILFTLDRRAEAAEFLSKHWDGVRLKGQWAGFIIALADSFPELANSCMKDIINYAITVEKSYDYVAFDLLPKYKSMVLGPLKAVQDWRSYSEEFRKAYTRRRTMMPMLGHLLD